MGLSGLQRLWKHALCNCILVFPFPGQLVLVFVARARMIKYVTQYKFSSICLLTSHPCRPWPYELLTFDSTNGLSAKT